MARGGERSGAGAPFKFYANKGDLVIMEVNNDKWILMSEGTTENGNTIRLKGANGQYVILRKARQDELEIRVELTTH